VTLAAWLKRPSVVLRSMDPLVTCVVTSVLGLIVGMLAGWELVLMDLH
jgi:hypothetical protein